MIIKYICECCDRIVEEMIVSEDLVSFLNDEDSAAVLTGLNREDIINLEHQGSLTLQTMCPTCLSEVTLNEGDRASTGIPVIN